MHISVGIVSSVSNVEETSEVTVQSKNEPPSKRKTQHLYTRYVGEEFKVRYGTVCLFSKKGRGYLETLLSSSSSRHLHQYACQLGGATFATIT
jgi:hypothetical protein